MASTDIQPSRIERAKFKISDILGRRDEGLTGLVVYAGDAYVVTPLTSDKSNILNLLPSLHPEMMPIKGSNLVATVTLANDLFDSLGQARGRIILLTDGITNFGVFAIRLIHAIQFQSSVLDRQNRGIGQSRFLFARWTT